MMQQRLTKDQVALLKECRRQAWDVSHRITEVIWHLYLDLGADVSSYDQEQAHACPDNALLCDQGMQDYLTCAIDKGVAMLSGLRLAVHGYHWPETEEEESR